MTVLYSYLFRLLGVRDIYARYDHIYLNFGRLKQEGCKFLASLGCLVKPCLQTEQNNHQISILLLGEQEPSLSLVLISKNIGNEQTQTSVVENDPWASKLCLLITKGDLTMTQHNTTLSMSNPAIFTQHTVIQNSVAQFPCQSIFCVGHLSSLSIISWFMNSCVIEPHGLHLLTCTNSEHVIDCISSCQPH